MKVEFVTSRGERVSANAEPGDNLLRVAQAAGLPLEGTCEGEDWFDRLEEASEEEEDMLDLAAGVARTSRLSCQIDLTPELDGLEIRIPAESHDMRRF